VATIFISFTNRDQVAARAMSRFLGQLAPLFGENVDTFHSSDRNVIFAGDDWMKRVFDELQPTKILISMLSPKSVKKPWINFEAGAAWLRGAKVIPVCFGGLTVGKLPKPYSNLQAVEIDNAPACYYLAASIAHHLDKELPEWPANIKDPNDPSGAPYRRLANAIRELGPPSPRNSV
jgi:hypothetical protein